MGNVDPGITIAVITGVFGIIGILVAGSLARKRSAGKTAEAVTRIAEPTETAVAERLRQDGAEIREMRAELRTVMGQMNRLSVRAAVLAERLRRMEEHAEDVESQLNLAKISRDEALGEHKQLLAELAACRAELGKERAS